MEIKHNSRAYWRLRVRALRRELESNHHLSASNTKAIEHEITLINDNIDSITNKWLEQHYFKTND